LINLNSLRSEGVDLNHDLVHNQNNQNKNLNLLEIAFGSLLNVILLRLNSSHTTGFPL